MSEKKEGKIVIIDDGGVNRLEVDGKLYISVEDITRILTELGQPEEDIAKIKAQLEPQEEEPFTEFNKNLQKALNFNPRKSNT